jgi:hypothetical protein
MVFLGLDVARWHFLPVWQMIVGACSLIRPYWAA